MTDLTPELLYDLTDDAVRAQVAASFVAQVKAAPSVHDTFFANEPVVAQTNVNFADAVAAGLVCSAISRTSQFNFAATVDQQKADAFWQNILSAQNTDCVALGQALYASLFPTYCAADGVTFQQFLTDAPKWGKTFADLLKSGPFINESVAKLLAGQKNWLDVMNLQFYKLSRLDATLVSGVVDAWNKAFPDSGIVENWQGYNYLAANMFTPDVFINEVNAAIAVDDVDLDQVNAPMGSVHVIRTDRFGLKVASFVVSSGKAIGVSTGQDPKNIKGAGDQSGCFTALTQVRLAQGGSVAIAALSAGDRVMGREGRVSVRSDETVRLTYPQPIALYGFNHDAPFFNASHLFWTDDGWKAIDPKAAAQENPRRAIAGALAVGDVVHRIRSDDPVVYSAVKVRNITTGVLPVGTPLYGLHLQGARSYHANGYLVAMNYPQVHAMRLAEGFDRLTPQERAAMARTLGPAQGVLGVVLGERVGAALMQAMTQDATNDA